MANYGSAAGVASLTKPYTNASSLLYDTTTNPTLAEVDNWLIEASRILDGQLAQARFTVPVTAANVTPALDSFTNEQVARRIESIRRRSSRGPTDRNANAPLSLFSLDSGVDAYVIAKAEGFEQMGAERGSGVTRIGSVSVARSDAYG